MFEGATLRMGNKLVTSSGKHELRMQLDGNLVLYGTKGIGFISDTQKFLTEISGGLKFNKGKISLCRIVVGLPIIGTSVRTFWEAQAISSGSNASSSPVVKVILTDAPALEGYDKDGKYVGNLITGSK